MLGGFGQRTAAPGAGGVGVADRQGHARRKRSGTAGRAPRSPASASRTRRWAARVDRDDAHRGRDSSPDPRITSCPILVPGRFPAPSTNRRVTKRSPARSALYPIQADTQPR